LAVSCSAESKHDAWERRRHAGESKTNRRNLPAGRRRSQGKPDNAGALAALDGPALMR